ncbi:MAG TPA: DoxX family membrane protein [Thermoanaerobaculia bacterium]|nr:DoxX family membrane protein [Thermoanaerobaculia bacterium]
MPTTQPNLNLESLYRPLWLTYGLVPLLAGLDKFFNLLTDWPKYLAPWMANLLPVSAQTFMYAVGIIEIAVGLMVLTRWTRLGAWIAAAWLVLIALNLVTMSLFDIAVRDLSMAVGAYTLARLAELRQEAPARMPASNLRESRA